MPVHNIGDKTNLDKGNVFIELKAKNEKLNFRLAQSTYTYDAKHFTKVEDKWNISECPRLMSEDHCILCEKYFEVLNQVKQLKEENAPEKQIKDLENEMRQYKAKLTFYYAILNRDLKQAQIVKVTLSTRLAIEDLFNNGFSVVDSDFILTRTEKPGAGYYSLLRKDSKDVIDLDEVEEKEMEVARKFNLSEMTKSKAGSTILEEPPIPEDES